ncbi:helix-turn-helix domain-containing protein [Sulfitobacter sp. TSTF-M16]|uniref:Helix-turn-helix domain-containing protein n=2 Tax=Sulfitobacter aestuariivivens TaxID=2766981 RepID=A0A927D4B4_9RHOB|nr:helix-turn-helix domain-containing protein [Sulfitobacter aestuariivivens]
MVNLVQTGKTLPDWVPVGAIHYLAHTEFGEPIRALARAAGCHASTILRQVRKFETRRDDPLVDAALRQLGPVMQMQAGHTEINGASGPEMPITCTKDRLPDEDTLNREAMRVLRRLCETGAVLAVASEMEKAVVVRDNSEGGTTRTAVVAASVAQALALKEWIAAANTGRIVRYHITAAGRAALIGMMDDPASCEAANDRDKDLAPSVVTEEGMRNSLSVEGASHSRRVRYALAESPLIALSRKKDGKGKPFLTEDQVHAGERLREDFELAQMDTHKPSDLDRDLAGNNPSQRRRDVSSEARARVAAALMKLGPDLSDVALRCCCYLEGLETAERRLGWSARSGKIVLRIALTRLSRHYESTIGPGGPMIG